MAKHCSLAGRIANGPRGFSTSPSGTSPAFVSVRRREETSLDFGGFAKGYALKKIGVLLREAGVGSAFVDFGNSSILGIGRHPYGPCWRVSLPDPATGNALAEFDLVDRALSVSGNTAAHTEHIVNPRTGLRDASRQIVAVVADDPLDAEVVSTAWMIAGEFDKLEVYAYILHHG